MNGRHFFITAVLAIQVIWCGVAMAQTRTFRQTNEVQRVGQEFFDKQIVWFAGDSVALEVYARDGRTPLDLSGAVFPVLFTASLTNMANPYIAQAGEVVSGTGGVVRVNVSPENALLPIGEFATWMTVYRVVSGDTQEVSTVAYSRTEVRPSPFGTIYTPVEPQEHPWTFNVTVIGAGAVSSSDGSVSIVGQDLSITSYVAGVTIDIADLIAIGQPSGLVAVTQGDGTTALEEMMGGGGGLTNLNWTSTGLLSGTTGVERVAGFDTVGNAKLFDPVDFGGGGGGGQLHESPWMYTNAASAQWTLDAAAGSAQAVVVSANLTNVTVITSGTNYASFVQTRWTAPTNSVAWGFAKWLGYAPSGNATNYVVSFFIENSRVTGAVIDEY